MKLDILNLPDFNEPSEDGSLEVQFAEVEATKEEAVELINDKEFSSKEIGSKLYTQEELDNAKALAFESGHNQGLIEARVSNEQLINDCSIQLQELSNKMLECSTEFGQRLESLEVQFRECINLLLQQFSSDLPKLVIPVIDEMLTKLSGNLELEITIPSELYKQELEKILASHKISYTINILEQTSDIKLKQQDTELLINPEQLIRRIADLINRS